MKIAIDKAAFGLRVLTFRTIFAGGVLIATLLLCGFVFAESQKPSPTPIVDSPLQDAYSISTNSNATNDERGTDKHPLVVKTLDTEKSPEIVKNRRETSAMRKLRTSGAS